jgi:Na+(H+)/acetate symporter ActP
MKKRFTIAGAVSGLLFGVGFVSLVSIKEPGWQLALAVEVGIFGCAGALAGFVVGWFVSLCIRKNSHDTKEIEEIMDSIKQLDEQEKTEPAD